MYDARGAETKSGGGLIFGLLTFGVVSALFFGVLMFPSLTGPGTREVPGVAEAEPDVVLASVLDDAPTQAYLQKLRMTFPSVAEELKRDVVKAQARGADEVELGLIVLQAGSRDLADSVDRLSRADVRYFDQILDLTQSGLSELSRSGAPYCKGSDLIIFANLSDQQLYQAVFDRVGHGAGLYDYALEMKGIMLDGVRDARAAPTLYGPPNSSDMQALQALGISLMTNPEIMRLMTTEGKSRREMDKVLEDVNFCDLGASIAAQVDNLPGETKARAVSQFLRELAAYGPERMFYRYAY